MSDSQTTPRFGMLPRNHPDVEKWIGPQKTDLEEEVKRLRKWLENIYQCADEHEGEGHLGRMATRALKGDEPNDL